MNLHIPKMSCGGCAKTVTRAIQEADASASVVCNLSDRTVNIDTGLSDADVLSRLAAAGYPANPQ
jgi:copper chaperone